MIALIDKKILIVYGSRYGSTKEIAYKIAEKVEQFGIQVDIINAHDKKVQKLVSLTNYNGLLIGTGIRIGKWVKQVEKFVIKNLDYLKSSNILIGFFVSSGEASFPETYEKAKKKYLEDVIMNFDIKTTLYDDFGGVFDLSPNSKMNWLTKKMMQMSSKEEPRIIPNTRNDFRNWEQINNFANTFIQSMHI